MLRVSLDLFVVGQLFFLSICSDKNLNRLWLSRGLNLLVNATHKYRTNIVVSCDDILSYGRKVTNTQ